MLAVGWRKLRAVVPTREEPRLEWNFPAAMAMGIDRAVVEGRMDETAMGGEEVSWCS